MTTARSLVVACLLSLGLSAPAAPAAEVRPVEFIRALQDRGYHDLAADYLAMLKDSGDMPEELAEVYDLEMSNCLRGAANRAYDAKEAAKLMAEAQKALDKFLRDKPDHPSAVSAMVTSGSFAVDTALRQARDAKALIEKDKDQAAKLLAESRTKLQEARNRFNTAYKRLQERLAAQPAPPKPRPGTRTVPKEVRTALAARAQVENSMLESQFQIALVDYYLAQTYPDPKALERAAALKAASAGFDVIWQRLRSVTDERGSVNPVGLQAHMWDGKVHDDLGDWQTAIDIYDEVLASDPGPKQTDKVLDPLFSQVMYYRLMIVKRQKPDEFLGESEDWLTQYMGKSRYDGYQGVALEYAKSLNDLVEKASAAEKTKLLQQITTVLRNISRVPSSHQTEAVELLRKLGGGGATEIEVTTLKSAAEAAAVGNTAFQAKKWKQAVAAYRRALEIGYVGKDAEKRTAETRETLAAAEYQAVSGLYAENKFAEHRDAMAAILKEFAGTKVAPDVAVMAVEDQLRIWNGLAANNEETKKAKEEALARLQTMVKFVEKNWPGTPQADEANMLVGQALLFMGKTDEAIKVFEAVTPRSERYSLARYQLARAHWFRVLTEQQKGPSAAKDQMAKDREAAAKAADDSVVLYRKVAEKGKPLGKQHFEAELLQAEIKLDAGAAKEAAAIFQPLLDQVKAEKPAALDTVMLRVFFGGLKAYLAANEIAKATDVGIILADLGSDIGPVNDLLLKFARVLDGELQKAEAEVIKATEKNDPALHQAAIARRTSTQETIGKLLKKLGVRKQFNAAQLIYIADKCAEVGLVEDATRLYETVLELAKQGDAMAQKAVTRTRTQLIGLARKEGKFEEAVKQVDQLIEEHPRALEPRIEKGRVLQGWAEQDPSQFDKAVAHWHGVRNLLEPMRKKPPEYYEVIYYAADCLRIQAEKAQATDKKTALEKATEGAKILTSAKVLNPTLGNRQDLVAKFDALLNKLKAMIAALGGAKK